MMSLRISRSRGESLSASRVSMSRAPPLAVGTLHARVLRNGTRKGPGSQAGREAQTIDATYFGAFSRPRRQPRAGQPQPCAAGAGTKPPAATASWLLLARQEEFHSGFVLM